MKKLLILGAFLGLFGTSSIFASEVENVNALMEQVNVAVDYVDGVNYWVTDMHMDYGAGGPYFSYKVHWEYVGNRPNPSQFAYMVYVYDGTSVVTSFLDSAPYGSKVGSKEYKIKVDREVYYRIEVNGSDGGITR